MPRGIGPPKLLVAARTAWQAFLLAVASASSGAKRKKHGAINPVLGRSLKPA